MSSSDHDRRAIKAIAMDYAEGWYTGDAERMRRSLHPGLVKRTIVDNGHGAGWSLNDASTAEQMVQWTGEGGGSEWQGELSYELAVLDIFRDVASVRCQSPEYVDYLHLARFGDDGWRIVDVLWQRRPGEAEG